MLSTPPRTSAAYRQSAVLTASPARLVVMLYDGLGRFLGQAERALEDGDIPTANERMQRAEAILDELTATLNPEAGEVAGNLRELYAFCHRHLMQARVRRDPGHVRQVASVLETLRSAWAEVAA